MARLAVFSTSLDRDDPDAPWRWAASVATVAMAVAVALTAQRALHLRSTAPIDPRASTTVVQLGDTVEYIDEQAQEIALTSPHAPPTLLMSTPTDLEPVALVAQDSSARSKAEEEEHVEPPPPDNGPLITPDPSDIMTPEPSSQDPEPSDLDGDHSGGDMRRVSGPSAELTRGEMATCIVRRHDAGWTVQGCATGLHSDAIDLAASSHAGAKVMVTLRGT